MIKVPRSLYQLGDKVWVNPQEYEIAPFEAIIFEVRYNRHTAPQNAIEYALIELNGDKEVGGSDGWPENMISTSYPVRFKE